MPTELTVSPFRIYQQLPIAMEHPVPFDKIFGGGRQAPAHHYATGRVPQYYNHSDQQGHFGMMPHGPPTMHSGMPPTGPARMAECVPNSVLPNGMKNPWSAYSGETYVPNSQKVAAIDYSRSMSGYNGGQAMPVSIPAPNVGAGSTAGWAQLSMAGSAPVPAPYNPAPPNGWNNRSHQGHHPDPGATGGRSSMQDVNASGHSPRHPLNHVGLTPGLRESVSGRPRRLSDASYDSRLSDMPRRPSLSRSHRSSSLSMDHYEIDGGSGRRRRDSHSCCHGH